MRFLSGGEAGQGKCNGWQNLNRSFVCTQVLGWDVERVKPHILGPVGSQITITFQRVGNQVAGKRSIDVTMIRQLVDP